MRPADRGIRRSRNWWEDYSMDQFSGYKEVGRVEKFDEIGPCSLSISAAEVQRTNRFVRSCIYAPPRVLM